MIIQKRSTKWFTHAVAHPCENIDAMQKSMHGRCPQQERTSSVFAKDASGHTWRVRGWGKQIECWAGKEQAEKHVTLEQY